MTAPATAPSSHRPLRWGIAGPGRMAQAFLADFEHVDGAVPHAVGSRNAERAAAFAQQFGLERSFGSYAELCASPEVDVVYIATPHPQHKAIALEAIAHGKAVLVEKAFSATLAGAQEVVDAARAAGVFVMEAMWTRFHPAVRRLHEIVDSGELGELRGIQGDFCTSRAYDVEDRLFNKRLGGGAVLDLGVYALSFAQDFLGNPTELVARGHLYDNGVDAHTSMLLGYPGAMGDLVCSLRTAGPCRMTLMGEDGWVEVKGQFNNPHHLDVHRHGTVPQLHEAAPRGRGYSHEIEHVVQCLHQGLDESPVMPLADTLEIQRQMAQALAQLGVEYTDEELG